jgi:hypothetical protein
MSILDDATPLAQFWDLLPIQSIVWDELDQEARSQLGAGAGIRYDLGGILWRATVTLNPEDFASSKVLEGRLRAMRKIGRYFLATDHLRAAAPASDPGGVDLGASVVTIGSVDNDTGELTLAGLPAGYELGIGDMLQVDFGVPLRRALLSIDKAVTADGGGDTGAFTTTPVPWVGIEAGDPVALIRPSAVFAMLTKRAGTMRAIVDGASFEMLQVLDA